MMYIITHKKFDIPKGAEDFSVLQVGALGKEDLGYLKDSTGDNISDMNPFFCELTGMYWIWKNAKRKHVGICHYRRYFNDKKQILSEKRLASYLKDNDIVAPKMDKFAISVYKQYGYSEQHNISDFDCMVEIIKEKYPDYMEDMNRVMNENYFYPFNMMYMKKEIFDSYCSWLFDILFELEKRIPYTTYDVQKKRVFGYLSERLFLVWIRKNKIKVKEVSVLNTEYSDSIFTKIFRRLNTYSTIYLGMDFRKKK